VTEDVKSEPVSSSSTDWGDCVVFQGKILGEWCSKRSISLREVGGAGGGGGDRGDGGDGGRKSVAEIWESEG